MNPVAWLVEGYDGVGSHIRTVVASKPKPDSWVTVTPLYAAPKELSDDEIADLIEAVNEETGRCNVRIFDHTKVLLRKLKEKYEREPKENN
jgi:hypothetical protein